MTEVITCIFIASLFLIIRISGGNSPDISSMDVSIGAENRRKLKAILLKAFMITRVRKFRF